MYIEPIVKKWEAFGWNVLDINGHDMEAIVHALNKAETVKDKPTMIVARTVKGKGVSFFEGKVQYHGTAPTPDELKKALKELDEYGK
jgi:transketolase